MDLWSIYFIVAQKHLEVIQVLRKAHPGWRSKIQAFNLKWGQPVENNLVVFCWEKRYYIYCNTLDIFTSKKARPLEDVKTY